VREGEGGEKGGRREGRVECRGEEKRREGGGDSGSCGVQFHVHPRDELTH